MSTPKLPGQPRTVNLGRFKSAVEDGLTLRELMQRFDLRLEVCRELRHEVMSDVPGWRAKTGPRVEGASSSVLGPGHHYGKGW